MDIEGLIKNIEEVKKEGLVRIRLERKEMKPELFITNPNSIDSKGDFTEDGIFSRVIFGEDEDLDNVERYGIIYLGDNYVLDPLAYRRLNKLLSKAVLDKMITFETQIDEDGKFEENKSKNYMNLGLIDLKDRLPEILLKLPEEKKATPEYRTLVEMLASGTAWRNYIPVFSPKQRPARVNKKEKSYSFSKINSFFNIAVTHANDLRSLDENFSKRDNLLHRNSLLLRVQNNYNMIHDLTISESVKGKSGTIRKKLLGSRINFSARNVIIPDPSLAAGEVKLSYTVFLELYKLLLINIVSKTEGVSMVEATRTVEAAQHEYSSKIYKYMIELVNKTEGGMHIYLNRNPSISVSSIQIVKIVGVSDDFTDLTTKVSNNILSGMAGDFDGDVLNVVPLFSHDQIDLLEVQKPMEQHIRFTDGKFNRDFAPNKDAKLASYLLNNPLDEDIRFNYID